MGDFYRNLSSVCPKSFVSMFQPCNTFKVLIIVAAAISHNLFLTKENAHMILVTTILLTIVTTLIAPFLIKASFKKRKRITKKA